MKGGYANTGGAHAKREKERERARSSLLCSTANRSGTGHCQGKAGSVGLYRVSGFPGGTSDPGMADLSIAVLTILHEVFLIIFGRVVQKHQSTAHLCNLYQEHARGKHHSILTAKSSISFSANIM